MIYGDLPASWPEPVKQQVAAAASSGRIAAIRNAVAAVEALPPESRGKPFRLGIVRTFTLEAQLEALKLALAVIPSAASIALGELENIEQVLLDPASPVMAARPDAVLALWRLEDLLPDLVYAPHTLTADARAQAVSGVSERIKRLCEDYRREGPAPLFLATLPVPVQRADELSDLHQPHGWHDAVLRINQTILAQAAQPGKIYTFDFAGWATGFGRSAFDQKMDLYARQPIAAAALMSFASAIACSMRPLLVPAAKVLAVDLDNLLWGGIVGEDGIPSLKIGHDYPGNVYRRIQQALLNLKRRGVLLVLLSKNNHQDAVDAFAALPDMLLSLADFAAVRINWRPKHENLREVARELNLGLDSFVFADDQAFEREQMAFQLPAVKVLPLSEDPLQILNALAHCTNFDAHRVSAEDLARADDYAAQARRQELATTSASPERFLESLQIKAVIGRVGEATLPRAVQMLAKTNQFNVTTRRHGEAELRRMGADATNVLLTLALRDKFSDQGIVGLAIGVRGERPQELRVDSFLLSCRALGRGAEQVLWASLVTQAAALGYQSLSAEYLQTGKNQQVADLFDRLGMERIASSTEHCAYQMRVSAKVHPPAWVNVIDETGR